MTPSLDAAAGLRRVVRRVVLLNLGYFGIEFAVALAVESVSLFADSVDFLEDTSVNLLILLILLALRWGVRQRALVGMGLAGLLLVPTLATLWTAWNKVAVPVPPESRFPCCLRLRARSQSICFAPSYRHNTATPAAA